MNLSSIPKIDIKDAGCTYRHTDTGREREREVAGVGGEKDRRENERAREGERMRETDREPEPDRSNRK